MVIFLKSSNFLTLSVFSNHSKISFLFKIEFIQLETQFIKFLEKEDLENMGKIAKEHTHWFAELLRYVYEESFRHGYKHGLEKKC